MTTKPYTKFQLNTSKHDEKKCGKLNCYDFLSPKRGITHSKFDGIWRNANLICGSSLQSHTQNFSSIPQSMSKKSAENYLCVIFQVQQRGITHSKFDKIRQNMNFICETSLQSHTQNFSSILQSMSKKSAENYCYDILSTKRDITH